jgi:two-component system, cell cycle sensor histidine kinase PleC
MRILQKENPSFQDFLPKVANKNFFSDLENSCEISTSSHDLLPSISHELKTPINAIIGFSDVLREAMKRPNSADECLDYINEISTAAFEMSELISDLLDVTQALSGNFSVDISKKIDVSYAVKRAAKLNHDYALRRNISLKLEISESLKPINLDAKRVKQIVTNLISNAIKYSAKNTEVKVICKTIAPHPLRVNTKPDPEFLEISVIDQGLGMTESQVQIAFQKYKTIENPNSKMVDSFGLGLPIVKQLTELQDGSIEVRSEIGKGTEMRIRFPYKM